METLHTGDDAHAHKKFIRNTRSKYFGRSRQQIGWGNVNYLTFPGVLQPEALYCNRDLVNTNYIKWDPVLQQFTTFRLNKQRLQLCPK